MDLHGAIQDTEKGRNSAFSFWVEELGLSSFQQGLQGLPLLDGCLWQCQTSQNRKHPFLVLHLHCKLWLVVGWLLWRSLLQQLHLLHLFFLYCFGLQNKCACCLQWRTDVEQWIDPPESASFHAWKGHVLCFWTRCSKNTSLIWSYCFSSGN